MFSCEIIVFIMIFFHKIFSPKTLTTTKKIQVKELKQHILNLPEIFLDHFFYLVDTILIIEYYDSIPDRTLILLCFFFHEKQ